MSSLPALVAALVLLLAGCAAPPALAPDTGTAIERFEPHPGTAALYVYRDQGAWGGAIWQDMALMVDGLLLGQTRGTSHLRVNLRPGRHAVESKATNAFVLPLTVEPGRDYFVRMVVKMGGAHLVPVDEPTGRAAVTATRALAPWPAGAALPALDERADAPLLPLRLGVHYRPALRDAVVVDKIPALFAADEARYDIALGRWQVALLDQALRGAVAGLIELADWPPDAATAGGLDLLVALRPARPSPPADHPPAGIAPFTAEVTTPRGEPLATLDLQGQSLQEGWTGALRNGAARLVAALATLPALADRPASGSGRQPPAPIPPDRGAAAPLPGGVAMVPLGSDAAALAQAQAGAHCLEQALAKTHPGVAQVPAAALRVLAFPWLEAGVLAPGDDQRLAQALQQPHVARRLAALGVRLVLLPGLESSSKTGADAFFCGASGPGGGCFGYGSSQESTQLRVKVWDLAQPEALRDPVATQAQGKSWRAGFIFPVWHDDKEDTRREACEAAVDQLVRLLR